MYITNIRRAKQIGKKGNKEAIWNIFKRKEP